jgi:hypothetical protein
MTRRGVITMSNGREHSPGRRADHEAADGAFATFRTATDTACATASNDNVDDLAPLINLILAAGDKV